jgi:hypothetical protein
MMPLHYAARNGCSEVARVLIEHGGDVDARNAQGETPLVLATWELKSWKKDGNAAVIKKYEETVSLLRQSEAK